MMRDFGWMLGCIGVLFFAAACLPTPKYDKCEFKNAQLVESVVSGQIGQVIGVRGTYKPESSCTYDVRFSATQDTTSTNLLSNDGPVQSKPLAVIKFMRPYELRPVLDDYERGRIIYDTEPMRP